MLFWVYQHLIDVKCLFHIWFTFHSKSEWFQPSKVSSRNDLLRVQTQFWEDVPSKALPKVSSWLVSSREIIEFIGTLLGKLPCKSTFSSDVPGKNQNPSNPPYGRLSQERSTGDGRATALPAMSVTPRFVHGLFHGLLVWIVVDTVDI